MKATGGQQRGKKKQQPPSSFASKGGNNKKSPAFSSPLSSTTTSPVVSSPKSSSFSFSSSSPKVIGWVSGSHSSAFIRQQEEYPPVDCWEENVRLGGSPIWPPLIEEETEGKKGQGEEALEER
jgi:hypothetical protein